ncbi:DNA polymerase III subunit [Chryseobacterium sp. A321]
MNWEDIVGQQKTIEQLRASIKDGRVSHAQLFVGKMGYGTLALALAFAREILGSQTQNGASKVESLNHVDLHFSFPVFSEKDKTVSSRLYNEFREVILTNPYVDYIDWIEQFDKSAQFYISVKEVEAQIEKFNLKSLEGGSKILIVWGTERMNREAANKFLKFLEEPPKDTYILLLAESLDDFLPTILSRTQIVEIPPIESSALSNYLETHSSLDYARREALLFKAQGNLRELQNLMDAQHNGSEFEALFIQWVREAFQVRKKPEMLRNVILWARQIAEWKIEKQLRFLQYCADTFRLALLQNYGNSELVYQKITEGTFQWEKFSQFIHGANIEDILIQISEADFHLKRNGNQNIVWTDLGIKLSRYIHRKAQ